MVSEQNVDTGAEALKMAEMALRAAVGEHGPTHAVVLQKLEAYIGLCKQYGKAEQAAKLEEKANAIRAILAKQAAAAPATPVAAESASLKSTPDGAGAPSLQQEATLKSTPDGAGAPSLQQETTAGASSQQEATSGALSQQEGTAERHLFNSRGEHVAVFFDDALYSPVGKFLARWESDLDAFIDDKGWYFGQIIMNDRLGYDPVWHYRHMNFGTKATAGSRIGWSKQPDTDRTMLTDGYVDVSFAPDESE